MAFLDRVPDHRNLRTQRFSLLLLPHDDVYFEDYSANMYRPGHEQEPIEGRIKVCASCLVFDPKDYNHPIYSFPHKDIQDYTSWVDSRHNISGFKLTTKHYTKMKEANLVRPWQNERPSTPQTFAFSPTFAGCHELLPRLQQLYFAWKDKTYTETQTMLADITKRHQAGITFNMGWIEDLSEQVNLLRWRKRRDNLQ
ncbi:hypothetical protein PTSG_08276 [Salpingoeca rosetta]|uniref:FAN-like N-terminal PH domain-containing protein n=1 Tax=Salpingoeca rosetta (strain ATCC 50818 / BSB-021) TaxID=946362 RepID=F2UJ84_SALR5|nr:uncharacterized protein PTSG_08276 [Salpingoeca rosetta]EGD77183.1 hypothetical protein PTSG_08276 [Salpingoeca rosetta]|eukprot:XP_004990527.1 hypothetical protein PTSG_08276 [Salpingoeca rosetta]